jgi:hypothetical protein
LEREFGPEYDAWTAWLGRMREAIRNLLPRTERRKELLHLLALCKPQKVSHHNQGGNLGPLNEIGFGKPAEARVERASA